MTAGLPHFHIMMMALNHDGREPLHFAQLECNRVSEGEALILGTVTLLASNQPTVLRDMVSLLVAEDATITLLTAVTALGRAMTDSKIFPERPLHDPVRGCIR